MREFKLSTLFLLILCLLNTFNGFSQQISLFRQHNGRFDFTFVGNTLNKFANGTELPCEIKTNSTAYLNIPSGSTIKNAYLYWAGSGTGDFEIKFNDIEIVAEREFSTIQSSNGLPFFSAFADVTTQVIATGPAFYTLSELDLNDIIPYYCPNGTNFAGWALLVIYESATLPLNQVNIYDGLESIPDEINIQLNSLNVVDTQGAKIGFIAWEGDANIAVNETLRINNNILSAEPLNPANNAFNGTSSVLNSGMLHNMDLDIYPISNFLQPGDSSANVSLTSGQDFVMINAVITTLNSQVPDISPEIKNIATVCDSREITVSYQVKNQNSTADLRPGAGINFYINEELLATESIQNTIEINGIYNYSKTLAIPEHLTAPFVLKITTDEDLLFIEIDENNNDSTLSFELKTKPNFNIPLNMEQCYINKNALFFDISNYIELLKTEENHLVSLHRNETDAQLNTNAIENLTSFEVNENFVRIYVRISDGLCENFTFFDLNKKPCKPIVYNAITPNNDGLNDTFFIDGLRDVFENFKLEVYNRWGRLIWTGNNNTPDWDGRGNENGAHKKVSSGTYYYILNLGSELYPEPIQGYIYVN